MGVARIGACAWLIAACGRIGFDPDNVTTFSPCDEPFSTVPELVDTGPGWLYDPALSGDQLELYAGDYTTRDLWVAHRATRTSRWSAPIRMPVPPNDDMGAPECCPTISNDGLELFFTRGPVNAFIYESRRVSRTAPWQVVVAANAAGQVDISADGLELYGADYGTPVRVSTRTSRDLAFDPAVDLPAPVNLAGGLSTNPAIASNGLELYFESDREPPYRLFVATRTATTAPWTNVQHIALDTTLGGGAFPDLSADGHVLTFTLFDGLRDEIYRVTRCEE